MNRHKFTFVVHDERLAIARLGSGDAVPDWVHGRFVNIARTPSELSIICAQEHVPQGVKHERDRVALGIAGVVEMTSIGILAELCAALAAVRVPVFVLSTYDTDWLLVSAEHFAAARTALEDRGHTLAGELP